jgi:flagellar assembly protein FliH
MATIIRKDHVRPSSSGQSTGVVAFSFADIRSQADDYLSAVQQEAAKIVQQAHQQAEQVRREAEAAGRKAAEAAIERILDEKITRRMDTLVPALQQLVQQIDDARGEMQRHWEQSALKVATAIAERIVRRELSMDPQISLDLIAEALRLANGAAEITLYISPNDHENLGSQIGRLAETLCKLAPSNIVADPAMTPGGCRVVTQYGEIDQRIEAQLQRIEQDLA